jgi:Protein of unknown function (DUF732)
MKAIAVTAAVAAVISGATVFAAPAQADATTDAFLQALNNSGIAYNDPSNAVALGQSVCPLVAQPGGSVASVASNVVGTNGISPDMAGFFTTLAISTFCPSVLSSLANGNWMNGMNGMNGISGIPGVF